MHSPKGTKITMQLVPLLDSQLSDALLQDHCHHSLQEQTGYPKAKLQLISQEAIFWQGINQ